MSLSPAMLAPVLGFFLTFKKKSSKIILESGYNIMKWKSQKEGRVKMAD